MQVDSENCSNKVVVTGKKEDLEAFVKKYCFKPNIEEPVNGISFNKVIECPEELFDAASRGSLYGDILSEQGEIDFEIKPNEIVRLLKEKGMSTYESLYDAFDKNLFSKEEEDMLEECFLYRWATKEKENMKKHGYPPWYSFYVKRREKTWDANNCKTFYKKDLNPGEICFYFRTGWKPAYEVIDKLTEDNPHLDIVCYYVDIEGCFGGIISKGKQERIRGAKDVTAHCIKHFDCKREYLLPTLVQN